MEFLVKMTIALPSNLANADQIRIEEAARAARLSADGILRRLWRIPGTTSNWGLWECLDATSLHAALMSLPLAQWSTFEVEALADHPNDPDAGRRL